MILLDCGNSSIKAQRFDDHRLQSSFSCAYRLDWTGRLGAWLAQSSESPVYLCSVLDRERQHLLDDCLQGFDITRFRSEASSLGVTNAYHRPDRLGSDRWMALLGAAASVPGSCMVIDAGSAITVDLLGASGRHLGGAILPGFNTSIEAFRRIFSHIDFDALPDPNDPGYSTETAIQIDYAHGSIARLPVLVNRWIPLLDDQPALLLAGGDAARVQSLLEQPTRVIPDLVFRGMRRLIAA